MKWERVWELNVPHEECEPTTQNELATGVETQKYFTLKGRYPIKSNTQLLNNRTTKMSNLKCTQKRFLWYTRYCPMLKFTLTILPKNTDTFSFQKNQKTVETAEASAAGKSSDQ